jgi:hypothetical protein
MHFDEDYDSEFMETRREFRYWKSRVYLRHSSYQDMSLNGVIYVKV